MFTGCELWLNSNPKPKVNDCSLLGSLTPRKIALLSLPQAGLPQATTCPLPNIAATA
jgi:hypothetical protein